MLRTLSYLCLTIIILQLVISQTSSLSKHTLKNVSELNACTGR